ncbi:MAG: DUF4258 domain-containing protein [Opitutales bacterium]|jgi:uncharacterized DUF497 family protein|nr:DUF4258 domain-containing protein [Opitutales bacterium]MDP4643361.1 DUF4258 domain-containing protein [Opitutales bacterium]MDP4693519.1 DUF4258 domain-containing protein [Opitutales bacterium]MDP4778051.1 DUF4258 domain-containing protein [Opitutales bacterium]MDP4878860.1 DUF4258 domain-containing protein [Opitutales bacterium]
MFDWSDEKDATLRTQRGICFQDAVYAIEQGDVLAIADHPNQAAYPNQKIIYLKIEDYVYLVPYVQDGETLFLKTIIPSRKATMQYLMKGGSDESG